jgi:hypothetical protein
MATKTTYANELGTCIAKQENYRAYNEGSFIALYHVAPELIWNADLTDFKVGKKLEAVKVGYINNIENFNEAVEVAKSELASMMA